MLTRTADLAEFVACAAEADALALDTEFVRERTYYPELCLIQAAIPGQIVLIDTLAELDLSLLGPVLAGGGEKILHSCSQDQEVMALHFAAPVRPLFDTQVAAALCGHPSQWSYANLIETLVGVKLAKDATRTDWSRRPLSAQQLDYAVDDVRYLAQAAEVLRERLAALGRQDWFEEDMRRVEARSAEVNPLDMWQKVKGYARLNGAGLARLRQLAAWREREAQARNRPRRWIVADETLLAMAEKRPVDMTQLAAVPGLEPATLRRHGENLLALLLEAADESGPELDLRIPDKGLMRRLRERLDALAKSLGIDASLLATRADLSALALGQPCPNLSQGWRAEVVGEDLRAAL